MATIHERILEISVLPVRYKIMLEQALSALMDDDEREELCAVASVISNATWQVWQSWRSPEDNRQEHEWVVFANVMRIAEAEGLSLSEKRIATAFAFTHDSFPILRIMEQELRVATDDQKKALKEEKRRQRKEHMEGGAENARFLLSRLRHPGTSSALLSQEEIQRCVDIVGIHDLWKVDPPSPPPTSDRLAIVCIEGDALWPLHPIGVLADLDRPDNLGRSKDMFDAAKWHEQLEQSLRTLTDYRPKWKDIADSDFIDGESIFRTREGHRLYSAWRSLWNL